jgi:hypothetical protein
MIYLTAIALQPVGSSTVLIYTQTIHITTRSTQTIHRTTQFTNIISNNTKLCAKMLQLTGTYFPYLCITYPPHLEEFPSFFHHQLLPCALLPCLVASFYILI